jgi:hypothetical protein
MKSGFTKRDLRGENHAFHGSGGRSQENGCCGFSPAFLDTETGIIYRSCFSDGRPAPVHLLDGLSENVVLTRASSGRVTAVKGSIVAGFTQNGRFYTREEAALEVRRAEPTTKPVSKRPSPSQTPPASSPNPLHDIPQIEMPFHHTVRSYASALELGRLTMISGLPFLFGHSYSRLWKQFYQSSYDLFDSWLDYSLSFLDDKKG